MEGSRRTFCQNWDEYFMATAVLCSKLSRNPQIQVGACIVNDIKQIVGIGYNGAPREYSNNNFHWYNGPRDYVSQQSIYVPHAEINALMYRTWYDIRGCTIYVTLFPCERCARAIIEAGIRTVIYLSEGNAYKMRNAQMMFNAAGVAYRFANKKIEINFTEIFR